MEAGDTFYGEHLSDYSDDFEEDESAARSNQPVQSPPPRLDFYSTFTPRHVKQDSSFAVKANKTDPVLRKAKSQYMSGRKGSKMNKSFVKGVHTLGHNSSLPNLCVLLASPHNPLPNILGQVS